MMCSIIFLFSVLVACLHAEVPASDVACPLSQPRLGGAMIQTRSQLNNGPEEAASTIAVTTRMSGMEERVGQLEQVSAKGRADLQVELDTLTATFATFKAGGAGSLEDTVSRVTTNEGSMSTLEATTAEGNQAVRTEIETLRTRFETLSKEVGKLTPALLQVRAGEDPAEGDAAVVAEAAAPVAPAAAAAAPAAAGGSLLVRCGALENRVDALEALSTQGRDDLKNALDALEQDVETVRAGGVASLEHTLARQGSAEKGLSTMQDTHDTKTEDMRTELEALRGKLNTLGKSLGADALTALLQVAQEPAAAAAAAAVPAAASAAALSLTVRMEHLKQRIGQLEAKSGEGRTDIQSRLTELTSKVDGMQKGGTSSLEHTKLRVTSSENDLTKQTSTVETTKASLIATVEELKAKTTALEQLVGSAR